MILDWTGKPFRKSNTFEAPRWAAAEAVAMFRDQLDNQRTLRVLELRESVTRSDILWGVDTLRAPDYLRDTIIKVTTGD